MFSGSDSPSQTETTFFCNASLNEGLRACRVPLMKFLFALLLSALFFFHPTVLRADEASHRAAAESLLTLMDMDKMMSQSADQMLQIQIRQNPSLAQYEPQMRTFLNKYLSWASMKDDMLNIYTSEFTEDELKQLTAFYQTPLGKKTVSKMPALMQKGAEISQKRLQEHLPELQAAIQAAGPPKGASPAPAASTAPYALPSASPSISPKK